MWPYGVNDSRSRDFKIRNRSGQVIYDWTDVHVNTLRDLARADYFSEAGAPAATKAIGEQTFRYINGERPTESLVHQKFILLLVLAMQVIRFHLKHKDQQRTNCIMQPVVVL